MRASAHFVSSLTHSEPNYPILPELKEDAVAMFISFLLLGNTPICFFLTSSTVKQPHLGIFGIASVIVISLQPSLALHLESYLRYGLLLLILILHLLYNSSVGCPSLAR